MACSCGTNCGGKCSSCASNNNFGWGSCSCGSNCSGSCSAACAGNCSGGCKGGCNTTCNAGCTNNCGHSCSTGCADDAQLDLYVDLSNNMHAELTQSLNRKIYASDYANINKILLSEATRRKKTVVDVSNFNDPDAQITAADFNQLQTNLNTIGYPTTGDIIAGEAINLEAHKSILDQTMAAYEEIVRTSSQS